MAENVPKVTFWTIDRIWIIWFDCKWSKTVPIMVEYHRPPFTHVEIGPRKVRRCPEGAQYGRKCPKCDFLDYWSNLDHLIWLQMVQNSSYYGEVKSVGQWSVIK